MTHFSGLLTDDSWRPTKQEASSMVIQLEIVIKTTPSYLELLHKPRWNNVFLLPSYFEA